MDYPAPTPEEVAQILLWHRILYTILMTVCVIAMCSIVTHFVRKPSDKKPISLLVLLGLLVVYSLIQLPVLLQVWFAPKAFFLQYLIDCTKVPFFD